MQFSGHVIVNGEKIKVLARVSSTNHSLRIRQSGSDGQFLEDEAVWLSEDTQALSALKSGQTIGGKIPKF
ncbi:MAG: hypothetical protein QNJ53_14890 [Pleurocapsa sp. MO_192.B19]|nr:hypothetical protein [Pleurocapsa sp. MO_192.B19]